MTTDELYTTITHALTDLIGRELRGVGSELHAPGFDVDASEARIRRGRVRAAALRVIREQFETLMNGETSE